jgi:branched-chain amino acid transport system ATP-binding protein
MMTDEILVAKGISFSFGKFLAVNGVNLAVKRNETKAIIGPNGAGKTTFFNLLTGALNAQRGSIFFDGTEITNVPIYERVRLGISRSFQIPNIFNGLDVFQNLMIAVQSQMRNNINLFARADRMKEVKSKTEQILELVGLSNKENISAGSLSHGDKRLLEISLTLGTNPQLLLLDEPTAGLSDEETEKVTDLIRSLTGEFTIVFIEHDMDMVMSVAEEITVMHMGEIAAEGPPIEIKQNKKVQAIYLGED